MSGLDNQNVLVLSSDDELTPSQASRKSAAATKTINITIADSPVSIAKSTKITIQIEDSDLESQNSHVAKAQTLKSSDEPKTKVRRVTLVPQPKIQSEQKTEDLSDFSERFIEFMELCSRLDPSEDMKRVLERKVRNYYRKAESAFVLSKEFDELLADSMRRLRSDVSSMWVHIKTVVDALRSRKVFALTAENPGLEWTDPATAMEVQQLEKTLERLQRVVHRLEEQEVDFEKESSSTYLLADSAKAKLVRVHARLCALRGERAARFGRVRLARAGRGAGRSAAPAAALEAWVNAPVAEGRAPRFPDFRDVLGCVRAAVARDQPPWSRPQLMKEARELFAACGRELQRRRRRREWRLAAAHLPAAARDPAAGSAALRAALAANGRVARAREQQVFDKFENMEMLMKTGSKANDIESETKDEKQHIESKSCKISCQPQMANDSKEIVKHDRDKSEDIMESSAVENERKGRECADGNNQKVNTKETSSTSQKRESDCETISSDGSSDDESDSSERSREDVLELSDTDIEKYEVSDSDAGSDVDELKLLRRVQESGRYSTRVYDVHNDASAPLELSDSESDSSACVLVHSEDERSHSR